MRRVKHFYAVTIWLPLVLALVALPLGMRSVAVEMNHADHLQQASHMHETGHVSSTRCPNSDSVEKCEFACGLAQYETVDPAFPGEGHISGPPASLNSPQIAFLAGLGSEPPDQPPRF